jgi:hypothetical protein
MSRDKTAKLGSNISGIFITLVACNDHIIDLIPKSLLGL